MLTQTLQGALQAEIRAATGKTNQDFNGDLHDLCTIYGVPMAPISGRIIPVAQIFDSSINSSSAALNYLLKNATTVVGPRGLFASGEQGAWYDPSDLTTLFQDSAGTTPVTAVEQPVGLVLDKSKGLVLGSELVAGNASAYTGNGTVSTVGDTVTATCTTNGIYGIRWASAVVSNVWTRCTFEVVTNSASKQLNFYPNLNHAGVNVGTGVGAKSYILFAPTATGSSDEPAFFINGLVGESFSVRLVSVRELPGNHAYQTTSTSRPTLRARYNLLTYSEQFDNAAWSKSNVTIVANQAVAPDGTTTADLMYPTTSGNDRGAFQSVTLTANTPLTYRTWVRNAGKNFVAFTRFSGAGYAVWVDLTTGATSNLAAGYTASTTATANGWTVTITGPASAITYVQPTVCDAAGSIAATANGTDGIFIWGAQLTQTAVFPSNTYQRIAAATDYATGAAFPPYLFFDGVDDSLLTNSVDFSATDKMTVWAGVTKSSDAAAAILAELSATAFTNNGAFAMSAPGGALNSFFFRSRGTAVSDTEATFAAPTTRVVTGVADIGADTNILRVNGAQAATSATDQGTGNFGNYPLYIGRRNNVSLPLNGNIYSLIIRGAQSTAAQISSTESWVAAKTPLGSL